MLRPAFCLKNTNSARKDSIALNVAKFQRLKEILAQNTDCDGWAFSWNGQRIIKRSRVYLLARL